MDPITRTAVITRLRDYFEHRLALADLVDWAEGVMLNGEFADPDAAVLRDVVARLGVADVRAFGLTWDDCEELVQRLGYRAEITLRPSTPPASGPPPPAP